MEKKPKNKRENNNHNKKNNKVIKKKKSTILNKILILLLLILIVLVGTIIYRIKQNGGGMTGLLSTLVGHDQETLKNLEPIQVLLMGVSTDNGGQLTDTIIIGTYNPKNQSASLLSIPRDTFVGNNPKTGTGSDKINALYQKSPEKTLEKVNELTGLNIEYYMVIDNQALIELVDVIEGVEFNVPIDMVYDDTSQNLHINLKAGLQVLDGEKAEQLLRFRHGNNGETYPSEWGDNDMGRMKTQREFMIETAKQTLQAKNILKIKDIIDIAYEYIETNLSISVIKDYVPYAINLDINSIRSEVLPGASYGPSTTPSYPLWFFIADEVKTEKLIEELYGTDEETEEQLEELEETDEAEDEEEIEKNTNLTEIDKNDASKIKIELLNGTGSTSALTEVKKMLTTKGYNVTTTTTTTTTSKTTIINKTDIDTKFIDDIKESLEVGNVSTSSVSSSKVDITIIIGKDYIK